MSTTLRGSQPETVAVPFESGFLRFRAGRLTPADAACASPGRSQRMSHFSSSRLRSSPTCALMTPRKRKLLFQGELAVADAPAKVRSSTASANRIDTIDSLNTRDDDELQQQLNELAALRRFQ